VAIDAPDRAADAAPDGPTVSTQPFCDPTDPHLVACYEFEGDTKDRSNHHLDATMVNVPFPAGKAGMAMQFGLPVPPTCPTARRSTSPR